MVGELRKTREEVLRDFRTDQILEAAEAVIAQGGYADASVDRIAAAAGVARSTVYVYFEGKEAILDGCLHRFRLGLTRRIRAALDDVEGPEARLAAFLSALLGYAAENREFVRAVIAERGVELIFAESVDNADVASIRAEGEAVSSGILTEALWAGQLGDVEPAVASDVLATLVYGALMRHCYERRSDSVADDARALARVFLRGVASS